ncbi:hypothetical protein EH220_05950 [bacterium]|nr:MAG: hypothetical protein EH220_05950 [bacterium]
MADWSWKNAVLDKIKDVVNETQSPLFELDNMYAFEREFAEQFPRNKHVQAKIRQVLQQLRDEGLLVFGKPGHYALNLMSHEYDYEGDRPAITGLEVPARKAVVRNLIVRNPACAREMKAKYRYTCQVCRCPVQLASYPHYAEAHHLIPLGDFHSGPDVPGNIIVLCPNHHKMFDYGAAAIVPDSLILQHAKADVFNKSRKLHLASWHKLSGKSIMYHFTNIYQGNR